MRVPMMLPKDTINPYLATRAVLLLIREGALSSGLICRRANSGAHPNCRISRHGNGDRQGASRCRGEADSPRHRAAPRRRVPAADLMGRKQARSISCSTRISRSVCNERAALDRLAAQRLLAPRIEMVTPSGSKSLALRVAMAAPRARAEAAIKASRDSAGRPCESAAARKRPACSAISSSIATMRPPNCAAKCCYPGDELGSPRGLSRPFSAISEFVDRHGGKVRVALGAHEGDDICVRLRSNEFADDVGVEEHGAHDRALRRGRVCDCDVLMGRRAVRSVVADREARRAGRSRPASCRGPSVRGPPIRPRRRRRSYR